MRRLNIFGKQMVNLLKLEAIYVSVVLAQETMYQLKHLFKSLDSQSRGPVFKSAGWLQGRLSLSSFQGR